MSDLVKNIFRFLFIIAIQVLILDKISLRWWSNPMGFPLFKPMVYPLFILLLPFEVPVWALIILGFVTGITVDSFMNTVGMHAMATVLIAYLRTNVLSALMQKNLKEYPNQSPGIRSMGWVPFLTYSAFLIVIHHVLFFTIEVWSLTNVGLLLLKIAASTVTSMLFVIVYLLLFTKQTALRS
jgi:rod shape-determining protein MreD